MRFRSSIPIGLLGVFVLAVVGCSQSSPSQPPGDLPAAAGPQSAARRMGGVRRAIAGCTALGPNAFVGAGEGNVAGGHDSGVLSGYANQACDYTSAVVAGYSNIADSSGSAAYEFIGAGYANTISNGATQAFAGAGEYNSISGGTDNFIGAGNHNTISGLGSYAVVGGGSTNLASGQYSSVLGGSQNTASATQSTVAGGGSNVASGYASFAAGYHAAANQAGSFVWSDSSSSNTTRPSAAYQFIARASGGVKFFSNAAMTSGVSLAAGSGTWSNLSDRAVKTNVASIDYARILDKVAAMPISQWSYISERGVRHLGPMAQDFYAAFGVGEDSKHITSIDEDGVALAAIKALNRRLLQRDAELQNQLSAMKVRMAELTAKVARLH